MLPARPPASNGNPAAGFPLSPSRGPRTLPVPPMDSTPTVYIRWQGKPAGPFSAEQLRELLAGGTVTPATEAAPEPEGPWAPLEAGPLRGELFPSVAFKIPAYERTNTSASPAIDLRDVIAAAQAPGPAAPVTPPAPGRPVSAEHDVASLLHFNRAIEQKHGLFTLEPVPVRRSRRRRDYFVLLTLIGSAIFTLLIIEAWFAVAMQTMAARMPGQFWAMFGQVLFHSPLLAWGLACFCFFLGALTWLMFGLMDDY